MRIPDRLRRPDWLAEIQSATAFVLAVLAVVGVAGIAMTAIGDNLAVELPASAVAAPDGLRPGVTVDTEGTLDAVIAQPDRAERVAAALTSLPTYLVVVAMLAILYAVARQARREDPFLAVTVNRLRLLALVALVGGPLAAVTETVAALDLTRRVTGDASASLDVTAIGLWTLAGFGFLAVAEIVNRGRAMRAELETVI